MNIAKTQHIASVKTERGTVRKYGRAHDRVRLFRNTPKTAAVLWPRSETKVGAHPRLSGLTAAVVFNTRLRRGAL